MTAIKDFTPVELDLKLYAGDGIIIPISIIDSDENAVPLTGTFKAQVRLARETPDPPIAEFSVDLTEADDGIFKLVLTGEQTATIEPPESAKKFKGVWDVEWTPSGAEPRTLFQGKVECENDVSR